MKIAAYSQTQKQGLIEILTVLGGALLLFAASQVEIPLSPVPITLQSVAAMLIGLTYSPRRALESHVLWLGAAAGGLPVLAGFSGGLAYLFGPTGGYLLGFLVAAYTMAILKRKYSLHSWKTDMALTLLGTCLIYLLGMTWLTHLIGVQKAFVSGLLPFIFPGIVKAGLLCTTLHLVRCVRGK